MNTKNTIALVGALSAVSLVACSDFMNSKTGTATAPTAPTKNERASTNPFPPGFENPNEGEFSEEKMLVNIGVNVIAKSVDNFALESAMLARRVAEACPVQDGAGLAATDEAWREAQAQWKRAMLAFHQVDAHPVGPLWADDKSLSSRLYAWPMFNPCGIDVETVKTKAGTPTLASDLAIPTRGLGALEYLLFEPTLGTKCNARAYPHVVQWAAKPENEKRRDRCVYAATVAGDVSTLAKELAAEWNPEGRNFSRAFIDGSDATMKTVKDATNAITDSLFQIETTKDVRLARPLGRSKDCTSSAGKCPESAEHPYSGLALRAIEARIRGFGDAFFGRFGNKEGFGFDDLLKSRGHDDIGQRLRAAVDGAALKTRELETQTASASSASNLQSLISEMDPAACAETTRQDRKVEICAVFQDVREVTTALKAEVLSVLALRAPPTYQGDND